MNSEHYKVGKNAVVGILAVSIMALLTISCDRFSEETNAEKSRITVVTTVYPITYFTERLVGERQIDIKPLITAGVDAHDFNLKPSDIRQLQEADRVIFLHPSFEGWIDDTTSAIPDINAVQIADLSESQEEESLDTDGHPENEDGTDPHIWLNPFKAIEMVERIRDVLIELDPNGANTYNENAAALNKDLRKIDEEARAALAECRISSFVTSHAAYGHLAELYNIEQIPLAGIVDEVESSPRRIALVINKIEERGIEYVLTEPLSSHNLAEAIAKDTDIELLTLHPLEYITSEQEQAEEDYFSVMRYNIGVLSKALDCS